MARFGRFVLLGIANTAMHAALVFLLVERQSVPPAAANVLAFVVVTLVSFFATSAFVFNARPSRPRLLKFFMIATGGAALAAILMRAALSLGLHYLFGVLFLAATMPVVTFIANRRWTFAESDPRE